MDTVIIIAIIGAVPGLIALILQFKKNEVEEKVSDAEIAAKITAAAGTVLDELRSQITELRTEVATLKSQMSKLKTGVNKLIGQIRARGEDPCWTPEEDDL